MIHGNAVAIAPSLHRGMVFMPEGASHFADAAEPIDDFRMGFHAIHVRPQRTYVNDESVRDFVDNDGMAGKTIGERLLALKARTDWTLDEIAKRAGYSGRSSVQTYFNAEYSPAALDSKVARKLADAFVGHGVPVIQADEIWSLVGAEIPPTVPTEDELAGILHSVHVGLPPGLPLSEWLQEVAGGLRTRLALLANDRATPANEDDPEPASPPTAGRRARPTAADRKG